MFRTRNLIIALVLFALAACGNPSFRAANHGKMSFTGTGPARKAIIEKNSIACVEDEDLELDVGTVKVGQAVQASTTVTITLATGTTEGDLSIVDCPISASTDATITPPATTDASSASGAATAPTTTTDTLRSGPVSDGSGITCLNSAYITHIVGTPDWFPVKGHANEVKANLPKGWTASDAEIGSVSYYGKTWPNGTTFPEGGESTVWIKTNMCGDAQNYLPTVSPDTSSSSAAPADSAPAPVASFKTVADSLKFIKSYISEGPEPAKFTVNFLPGTYTLPANVDIVMNEVKTTGGNQITFKEGDWGSVWITSLN